MPEAKKVEEAGVSDVASRKRRRVANLSGKMGAKSEEVEDSEFGSFTRTFEQDENSTLEGNKGNTDNGGIQGVLVKLKNQRSTVDHVTKEVISLESFLAKIDSQENRQIEEKNSTLQFLPLSGIESLDKITTKNILSPFRFLLDKETRTKMKGAQISNGMAMLLIVSALVIRITRLISDDTEEKEYLNLLAGLGKLLCHVTQIWQSAKVFAESAAQTLLLLSPVQSTSFIHSYINKLDILCICMASGHCDDTIFAAFVREYLVHLVSDYTKYNPDMDIVEGKFSEKVSDKDRQKLVFQFASQNLKQILLLKHMVGKNENMEVHKISNWNEFHNALCSGSGSNVLFLHLFGCESIDLKAHVVESALRRLHKPSKTSSQQLRDLVMSNKRWKTSFNVSGVFSDCVDEIGCLHEEVKRLDEELSEKDNQFRQVFDEKNELQEKLISVKYTLKETLQAKAVSKAQKVVDKFSTNDPDLNVVFTDEHLYDPEHKAKPLRFAKMGALIAKMRSMFKRESNQPSHPVQKQTTDMQKLVNTLSKKNSSLKKSAAQATQERDQFETELEIAKASEEALRQEVALLRKKIRKSKSSRK